MQWLSLAIWAVTDSEASALIRVELLLASAGEDLSSQCRVSSFSSGHFNAPEGASRHKHNPICTILMMDIVAVPVVVATAFGRQQDAVAKPKDG